MNASEENLPECEKVLKENPHFKGNCLRSPTEADFQDFFENRGHEDRSTIAGGKCLPGFKTVNNKCKKIISY